MAKAGQARAIALQMTWFIGMLLWSLDGVPQARALQEEPAGLIEVGSGPIGEPTMRLVGRSIHENDGVALTGYLTALVGFNPAALFADATKTVETARFTFQGEIEVDAVADRADVTETNGSGVLRIYFNDSGGAAWDDPGSFAAGTLVAEYTFDWSESLQRQAPGVGVGVGVGQLVQTTVGEFAAGGSPYRFGTSGIEQRLRYVGAQAGDGALLTMEFTGAATVTQRESRSVTLGSPNVVATPAAAIDACEATDAWVRSTLAGLDAARALAAGVGPDVGFAALDAAALSAAAASAAELADAQLGVSVPDDAGDAHRLAVTAISTSARGLQALADAATNQDDALLEQGLATLRDGESLVGRASEAANAVAETCGDQEAVAVPEA